MPSAALTLPTPSTGGAGSPELSTTAKDGSRIYTDPLPWCPILGGLGISEADFELNATFSSVTTLLNYLPKDRLIPWTAGMVADCAIRYPWVLKVFGKVAARWWYSTAGERARDDAGTRGTMIHDIAEDGESVVRKSVHALLEGREVDPDFLAANNVSAYVKGLQKFFRDYPGIRPIWVEVTVFSRRFGYAGTLDLIAFVPGLGIVLIDWKCSNYVLPKFSFQGAGYRWADYGIADGMRVPMPAVEGFYVVHVMRGEAQPDGTFEGAYEVVPAASDFELTERIMPSMHAIKALEHPSLIGKPLQPGNLLDERSAPPKLHIVTPAEANAIMAAAATSAHEVELLALDPAERLRRDRQVMRDWQVDYCMDRARALDAAAQSNPAAARAVAGLRAWIMADGRPKFNDPALRDIDQHEAFVAEVLQAMRAASRQLELPFGFDDPPELDWDEVEAGHIDDHVRAAESGLIVPDGDRYVPAPVRPSLGRGTVTLLRRGHSVDPDDWSKPRDPEAVALEEQLLADAAKLPADLKDELVAWARRVGVPNLTLRVANTEQLQATRRMLDELIDQWSRRCDVFIAAFEDIANPAIGDYSLLHDRLIDVIAGDRTATPQQLTGDQLLFGHAVMAAVSDDLLRVDDYGWVCPLEAAVSIKGEFGGAAKCLATAKLVADDFGLPKPKSSAEVFESPVLAALTVGRWREALEVAQVPA